MARNMEVVMNKRSFRNLSLVLMAVFLAWGLGFAKDPVKSSWTATPPTIDGGNADWTGAAFLTEKGVKVDYAFQNDGTHLYVFLTFKDPKFLSSIEATGINIYFNAEGKKKTDRGIRFLRRKVTGDEVIAVMEKRGEKISDQDRASLSGQKLFYLYDWEPVVKSQEPSSQAPANPVLPGPASPAENPQFKARMSENIWTYEFKIPLARSEAQPLGIGAEPGQTIKVGLEWGGMTEEMKKAAAARRGGRGNPSVIDMSASAEGLGGRGGDQPNLGQSASGPKKYDFWLDLQLATNK